MMYNTYIMRRTQIYLDNEQAEHLGRRARASGVTKSTVIREAIATYLATPDGTEELARFRAALDGLDSQPVDLPDGKAYVDALRAADVDRDEGLEARRAGPRRKRR